jgi:hypothetical protein
MPFSSSSLQQLGALRSSDLASVVTSRRMLMLMVFFFWAFDSSIDDDDDVRFGDRRR